MSRSYKKNYYSFFCCCKSDKPYRKIYTKQVRAKNRDLLKECENYYKDCKIFETYNTPCSLYGEVCCVDDWYYDNPKKYLINEPSTEDKFPKPCGLCIGCEWSENTWKDNDWLETPDEKIINSKIDRSVRYADKYVWGSDGGNYFMGDKITIRKDLEKKIFGYDYFFHRDIWGEYLKNLECLENKNKFLFHWDWFDRLFLNGIIPLNFKNKEELISWLREKENVIIRHIDKTNRRK